MRCEKRSTSITWHRDIIWAIGWKGLSDLFPEEYARETLRRVSTPSPTTSGASGRSVDDSYAKRLKGRYTN